MEEYHKRSSLDGKFNPLDELQIDVKDFVISAVKNQAIIIDTRSDDHYADAAIPGSVNIGLNGAFTSCLTAVIPNLNQPILLVCDDGTAIDVLMKLSRAGFNNCIGVLLGGFKTWLDSGRPITKTSRIVNDDFLRTLKKQDIVIIDVRNEKDFKSNHLKGAIYLSLHDLTTEAKTMDKEASYLLYCVNGYRSMIAASILKGHQIINVIDLKGGIKALKDPKAA
ncbi:metallo-beta-lactamase family protein [Nonlabens ulvanivorans]|nr:rhodanese-like domain-containing protein [Nonlabens ulvanivorans]GAK89730.1 metallo-beta-lactamase family protein [Nonlabens ulvanivorans]